MVRKILSDLVSGVRSGLAWGLAMSPPSRLTLWLLEPLAAKPEVSPSSPRLSSPPAPRGPRASEVVTRAQETPTADESAIALVVSRACDGVAWLLFFLWGCEQRARLGLHECKSKLLEGYAWGQAYTGWGL
jgi:hypothetical protein